MTGLRTTAARLVRVWLGWTTFLSGVVLLVGLAAGFAAPEFRVAAVLGALASGWVLCRCWVTLKDAASYRIWWWKR